MALKVSSINELDKRNEHLRNLIFCNGRMTCGIFLHFHLLGDNCLGRTGDFLYRDDTKEEVNLAFLKE